MVRSIISSPTNAPTNFYYRITGDSKERNTVHKHEYEYHTSEVMKILIPSTTSTDIIFLILSSPYDCNCLTSLKITLTQDRLYVPSVTSSMNSLSSSSFLDMDRTLSNLMSQQDFSCESRNDECTRQRLCPAIVLVWTFLTPTVSGDGVGTRFCVPLPTSPHFCTVCPERT